MYKKVFYLFILFTFISCTKKVQHFAKWQGINYNIDSNAGNEDSTVVAILRPYKNELDGKMNEVIGYLPEDLEKRRPGSTLTNFVADAVFEQYNHTAETKMDFFISNSGGIRSNTFAKGDVLVSDMYEIMPFENLLVIAEVDEKTIKMICNKIAASGGWPISKNSSFTIIDSMAASILINNEVLSSRKYRLGLPDYVANGGDLGNFLKNSSKRETGLLIRNLMIDYVKRVNKIVPDTTPRIKIDKP